MRVLISLAAALSLAAPAAANPQWSRYPAAREVQLRDVAALVRVTPENRTDVAVSIVNPGPLPEARVRVSGHRLIVDGRLRGQIRSCQVQSAGGLAIVTRRHGRQEGGAIPVINLRVPQDAVVSVGGAFRMQLAPAQSAHVRLGGCGDADIERVEDDVDISVSGSTDLRLYEAGSATVSIAGDGDVSIGAVRQGLTASIAGEGDLNVSRADGPISIAIQGDGDAVIREGRADTLSVAIFGDGDVTFGGAAGALDAAVFGDGDIRVGHVDGQVNRRVFGGGMVIIGR